MTALLRYAFPGGPRLSMRVDARHVREKAAALYAAGALYVTRRGKLITRRSGGQS